MALFYYNTAKIGNISITCKEIIEIFPILTIFKTFPALSMFSFLQREVSYFPLYSLFASKLGQALATPLTSRCPITFMPGYLPR